MAKNPEAKITVKMFADDFKKGASELQKESQKISREFKLQSEQMKLTASETEKLEAKLQFLTQKHDVAKRSVEQHEQAYQQAVDMFGKNSKAAEDMAKKLDNARIDEQKLANQIELTNRSLNEQKQEAGQAEQSIEDLGQEAEKTGDKLKEIGDGAKDMGEKMSAGITLPLTALATGAGLVATEAESSMVRIQNSFGLTAEEAQNLADVSRDIYNRGFGESLSAVDEALIQTRQNIRNLNEADLGEIATKALVIADTFDADVNEVTRAANNLMEGFGITAEEAFDQMAAGAQNGLNFSDELFDNLSEYSTLFGNMGFSVGEYFQLLQQGIEAGAYNLDYINDVMKEFQIRVKDGSKATEEAMGQMSEGTQKVWDSFLKGDSTVKDVSNAVLAELQGMDDQVKANEIGVALYGTKWEDLESTTMYALGGIGGELENVSGKADEMASNVEESFGARLAATFRQLKDALEPLGEVLLDFADRIMPSIASAAETVSTWFANLSPTMQNLTVIFGAIAAVIGPLAVGFAMVVNAAVALWPALTAVWGVLSKLGPAFTVVRTTLTALTGPVGIVIAIVTALAITVWKNWDSIKAKTVQIFGYLREALPAAWSLIKTKIVSTVLSLVTTAVQKFQSFRTGISNIFSMVRNYLSSTWSSIKSNVINFVVSLVSTAVNKFNSFRSNVSNLFNQVRTAITNAIQTARNIAVNTVENLRSGIVSKFNSLKNSASTIFSNLKTAITSPIESAKRTLTGIIDSIKRAFSNMKITIPKPKLPKISISTGSKSIAGVSIPYPKFSVDWFKTGGVFTKPVIAGNAGFGDVTEAIVPFEGSHAKRIARLIAEQQNHLSGMSELARPRRVVDIKPSDVILGDRAVGQVMWKIVQEFVGLDQELRAQFE